MIKLRIDRLDQNEHQTEGILRIIGTDWNCKTLELPWRVNQRRVSCIPAGTYEANLHRSPKFGNTVHIHPVPDRSEILIHAGNFNSQTLGCVLVGEHFVDINGDGQYDVTNSRLVMTGLCEKLESMLGDDKSQRFQVKIIDRFAKNETEFL